MMARNSTRYKNTIYLLLLLPLFFIFSASAQNYFQQEVNYKIDVTLNDKLHELSALESIEYINNSPDELTSIYMHLWPNAYKNNSTAMAKQMLENGETKFYYSAETDRGFIDQLDFKVNGKKVQLEYDPKNIDIAMLILTEPLKSGDSINITTPFHVKIPLGVFSRLGHLGESYQITQWYPKPAVYDLNGWNHMPYLHQGEFYSEFGSFDVSITLPENYVVGATGDLVDGEKETEWLEKKAKETEARTSFSSDNSFPASFSGTKTLRYKQSRVHDFAWFADKRFHVLKGEVQLFESEKKVTTWVMFTNAEAELWKNSIQYLNDAVYHYSLWNGDYPYNQITAVDGALSAGGGMEYPNITVIGPTGNAFALETVIMHEVGHNWFYGILGSNERVHPWMDEGINSFNENRYIESNYPEAKLLGNYANTKMAKILSLNHYKHKSEYELLYLWNAKKNEDQTIDLPASKYTELNYAGDVYSKTALVFDYLMAYLGEEKMDQAMHQYFETWKFKHPQPKDLRKIIETVSEKDLSWFFDDLINSTKKLDYKIVSYYKTQNETYDIIVKNTGEIKAPVAICGIKNNKLKALVWYDGFEGKQYLGFPPGDYDYFAIDHQQKMPEINRKNNILNTKGLLKKTEPLKLQFLGSLDDPYKTQLFFTPIVGWNNYNKTMLGVAFYNSILPQKKFEYVLAPMYSLGTNDFVGIGSVAYYWFPKKMFQHVELGVSAKKFAYNNYYSFTTNYLKISPNISFELKKKNPRSSVKQIVSFRSVNISEDQILFDPFAKKNAKVKYGNVYMVNELNYNLKNTRVINPFQINVNLQSLNNSIKTALTANYSITFQGKRKSVDFRLFAGTFISNYAPTVFGFKMAGKGYHDYMYDNIFPGRSENTDGLSQQFAETDGAFKVFLPILSTSQKWLMALNIKTSLPGRIPFRLYADFGKTEKDLFSKQSVLFNAGLNISVKRDIFEIYFPLVMSKEIRDQVESNYKFIERVRFTLNLNLLNPFSFIKNFSI